MDSLNERIQTEVENMALVDTHEHTIPESERDEYATDFTYLFGHYNSSDLVSAGMSPGLLESVRLPMYRYRTLYFKRTKLRRFLPEPERENMSLEERWQAMEPYWERIRNTAYARVTLLTIRELFGIPDLNKDTYQQLSQAIADSRRPGWYRHVMKEKANIDKALVDIMSTDMDQELLIPVMRPDPFIDIRNRQNLEDLIAEADMSIHTLDDLTKAMRTVMDKDHANGAVGVKSALAYVRILHYEKVSRHEAEQAFNRITAHLGEDPSFLGAKPLQDFMMHQMIRNAIDLNLPIQMHTGLQEGNEVKGKV